MLRRRSYPGMGTEPLISYAYRRIGFIASFSLILGSVISFAIFPTFRGFFGYAVMGGIGGILLFFIGIAFSEAWASSVCRSSYTPTAVSYRSRQLIFSFVGVVGLAGLVIAVAYLVDVF